MIISQTAGSSKIPVSRAIIEKTLTVMFDLVHTRCILGKSVLNILAIGNTNGSRCEYVCCVALCICVCASVGMCVSVIFCVNACYGVANILKNITCI